MKDYMFIIRGGDDVAAMKSPEEMQKHIQHTEYQLSWKQLSPPFRLMPIDRINLTQKPNPTHRQQFLTDL